MDHLAWGLQITVLGMGLVFGLLALLWGLLVVAARLDAPAAVPAAGAALGTGPAPADPTAAQPSAPSAPLVAAITVAVLAHHALRRAEAAPSMRTNWPGSLLHASRWVASGRMRQNRAFRKGR
jgi:Na+-transporting methylmalonyl-CoA/oxaloacetate decarboxylase gamma subunit